MGRVRPLERSDLVKVADLRGRVFRHSAYGSPEALAVRLERVFLANPWYDEALSSLVYEDGEGLTGFLGVVPRPLRLNGRSVRAAALAQFMVAPSARGIPGMLLYKAAFRRDQELLFTDISTSGARELWQQMGGETSFPYAVSQTLVLRPAHHAGRRGGLLGRLVGAVARLLEPHVVPPRPEGLRTDASAQDVANAMDMTGAGRLHGSYGETTGWLLDCVRDRPTGATTVAVLESSPGTPVGWFVVRHAGGESHVYAMGAAPAHRQTLLDAMVWDAASRGASALHLRYDDAFVMPLREAGAQAAVRGNGVLFRTQDREVGREILAGRAVLTGLEGEWWMGFS